MLKTERLCHSTWLFCFSNILKIYAFSQNFPLVGSVIGRFYWLFLWNFKEIKHQPFSMTQPTENGHEARKKASPAQDGQKNDVQPQTRPPLNRMGRPCRAGGTGGAHRLLGNQKPFQEGGLSKERLRKVDMHDVGEKDLEKYDKRRRERKVGEECPAGLAGGQHNQHGKHADGHADLE